MRSWGSNPPWSRLLLSLFSGIRIMQDVQFELFSPGKAQIGRLAWGAGVRTLPGLGSCSLSLSLFSGIRIMQDVQFELFSPRKAQIGRLAWGAGVRTLPGLGSCSLSFLVLGLCKTSNLSFSAREKLKSDVLQEELGFEPSLVSALALPFLVLGLCKTSNLSFSREKLKLDVLQNELGFEPSLVLALALSNVSFHVWWYLFPCEGIRVFLVFFHSILAYLDTYVNYPDAEDSIAQLVERQPSKWEVMGSIPTAIVKLFGTYMDLVFSPSRFFVYSAWVGCSRQC